MKTVSSGRTKKRHKKHKRTKAEFVSINCPENYETSLTYEPQMRDETRLDGKNNNKKYK